MSDGSKQQRVSVKAVLLGNSGVGKTSLANRWTNGVYQKTPAGTIGANHQRKRLTIGADQVDVFLWDTAGQEQFQALTPLYVRSSAVAVVTVAINDTSSFDSVDYWISLLSTTTDPTPPIVFAVNKIDLARSANFREEGIQQTFSSTFAGVFFVSAASNEGVDNLFEFVAQAGYDFVTSHRDTKPVTEPKEPPAGAGRRCC
jgi:small GTP-binding protein